MELTELFIPLKYPNGPTLITGQGNKIGFVYQRERQDSTDLEPHPTVFVGTPVVVTLKRISMVFGRIMI